MTPTSKTSPSDDQRSWLSPLYDQVTTTIYASGRPGSIESVDRTMALKLHRGGRSGEASRRRGYPTRGLNELARKLL